MNLSPYREIQNRDKYFFSFIALFGMLVSGLSIDIYSPSLAAVTTYFNVDKGLVQLTITTYIIGFGVAQLFAGSLSDSVGRKMPLMIAITLYSIFSFMIAYAQNIYQLQTLRFLQGVAVACLNVPTRAIIADLFEGPEFYKMMNYVSIAWAIGPIIAPAIGGYLQHYFGWYASFYFLAIYGVFLLILNAVFLPETIKEKHAFNAHVLFHQYRLLFSNKNYVLGVISLGAIYAMLILFNVVAPFLIQDVLHYLPIQFGYMAFFMGLSWFFGNLSNRLLSTINIRKKVIVCLLLMLFIIFIMLSFAIKETISIADILIPTGFLFYLGGIIFPNYFAQNVAIFQHIAGQANGLMGAAIICIGGLGSVVGILLKSHSQVPLTLAYLGIIVICLISSYFINVPSDQK